MMMSAMVVRFDGGDGRFVGRDYGRVMVVMGWCWRSYKCVVNDGLEGEFRQ
jgi:hypothetical protein